MGKYQPFNDLAGARFDELVEDVRRNGVLIPVLLDEDGEVIDGHQRRRAAAAAGVDCPCHVIEGLSEQEKATLAITLNLFRRHLAGTERAKAIGELSRLGMSTRRISEYLGLPKSTVHDVIRSLSESGQWERPETVTGKDGREQPSVKPPRPEADPEPPPDVVAETGEIVPPSSTTVDTDSPTAEPEIVSGEAPVGDAGEGSAPDPAPASVTSPDPSPETAEERAEREAEERRVDRNVYFGKHLIGLWALLGDGDKPIDDLIAGWVPEECPAWLVEPTRFVFTPDGMRDLARTVEKLAIKWEAADV